METLRYERLTGFKVRYALIVLFASLALCFMPNVAHAITDSTGEWEYKIYSGLATITGWNGSGAVHVPDAVDGYIVTEVGARAFKDNDSITSVTFSDKITKIGSEAFAGCDGLTRVELPEKMSIIDSGAFQNTYQLESVIIKSKELGFPAFPNMYSFVAPFQGAGKNGRGIEVVFDDTCEAVASILFSKNSWNSSGGSANVISVHLGNSLKTIYGSAFWDCANLQTVTGGDSLQSIGSGAFADCVNLERMPSFPNLQKVEGNAFQGCKSLVEFVPTNKLRKIGSEAFSDCLKLNRVVFPEGLETIGAYAFSGCPLIKEIDLPASLDALGECAFQNVTSLECVTIRSAKLIREGAYTPFNGAGLGSDGINARFLSPCTVVPENIFNGNENLKSVTLASTVKKVGTRAFRSCTELAYVDLGSSIEGIDESAFEECRSLREIVIPASLYWMNERALYNLAPNSVIYAGSKRQYNAFTNPERVANLSWLNPSRTRVVYRPIDMSEADISLGFTSTNYDGRAKTPGATVRMNGALLTQNKDYTVVYSNNVNAGTASVTVRAKGGYYTGSATKTFQIKPLNLAGASTSKFKNVVYTGKSFKPSANVSLGGVALASGRDYVVQYRSNKKVGLASVVIAGRGNYAGSLTKTFKILPTKEKIKSLKKGKRSFTVKWTKSSQATGYKIQYSTNKKFKKNVKTVVVKGKSKVTKTVAKLKAKKKYYVRVCAYKKVAGKTYQGAWSKTKVVRTR